MMVEFVVKSILRHSSHESYKTSSTVEKPNVDQQSGLQSFNISLTFGSSEPPFQVLKNLGTSKWKKKRHLIELQKSMLSSEFWLLFQKILEKKTNHLRIFFLGMTYPTRSFFFAAPAVSVQSALVVSRLSLPAGRTSLLLVPNSRQLRNTMVSWRHPRIFVQKAWIKKSSFS